MTPLEEIIRAEIAADGPMPMDRFMGLALGHPEHGYYMAHEPFGPSGDFVTAPEISQMFGEMIGLWVASVWQAMGAPGKFRLIELGPGRGTLMADLIRALSALPAALRAADIWLVETSPRLRQWQSEALGRQVTWANTLAEVPQDAPCIIIANEFFDALPVRQAQKTDMIWLERHVCLVKGELAIKGLPLRREFPIPDNMQAMPDGGIWEYSPIARMIATQMGARIARDGGAALIFDYGDLAGSGFHVHFSLVDENGVNVFDNGGDEGTPLMLNAVAGLLATMQQNTLTFAPHENSYRRLLPGAHAPTNVAWGYENRTAAIRIPGGEGKARRIEHRVAGADANPYLVLTSILGGALLGIEQDLQPVAPITGDAYTMKLDNLPLDWATAIDAFRKGPDVPAIFSARLQTMMVECKTQELRKFARQVTHFEYDTYLEIV